MDAVVTAPLCSLALSFLHLLTYASELYMYVCFTGLYIHIYMHTYVYIHVYNYVAAPRQDSMNPARTNAGCSKRMFLSYIVNHQSLYGNPTD